MCFGLWGTLICLRGPAGVSFIFSVYYFLTSPLACVFPFFHIKFSLSVGVDLCNLTLVFFNSLNLDQSFQVESFLSLSKKSLVSLNKISLTRLQLVTYFIIRLL